jgi:plastocyanin
MMIEMADAPRQPRRQESRGFLASVAILMLGVTPISQSAASHRHVVTIENLQFSPRVLTIRRGDSVVWLNKDIFPHTATADAKSFDSQAIAANSSWTYKADHAGSFSYGCSYHPTMRATLVVNP